MDLKEEDILGDKIGTHWYYVSKGRALRQFLGPIHVNEILDVGAGSGVFSRQLLDAGLCESATCVDPNYEKEHEENHAGKPLRFVRKLDHSGQTLGLMMDVLEHVDDDVALLREYANQMPAGSRILITVPAFQFLWSGHDVFLEHRRRYTAQDIEKTVEKAGLKVVKTRYFFGLLFPLIAAIRLIKQAKNPPPKSDLKIYPAWLNKALILIHELERVVFFRFNKLAGLSVFCLCEKAD